MKRRRTRERTEGNERNRNDFLTIKLGPLTHIFCMHQRRHQ